MQIFKFKTKQHKKNLKIFYDNIIMVHLNHNDTLLRANIDKIIYDSIVSKRQIKYKNISISKTDADERKKEIIEYIESLKTLKKIPIIKQRTIEWLEARKNRLTASDLGDALKKNNLKLAKQKAGIIKNSTNYGTIPALKWGTMFEEMASRCYSQMKNDINIVEFGLIEDPKNIHFGASPDGINEMGIMIEIKCPYSREIKDNYIPEKYYLQIQGQLAVCNLRECDYVECKFDIYNSTEEYKNDIEKNHDNKIIEHGIIAEYQDHMTNDFKYIYSAKYLTASDAIKDIENKVSQNESQDIFQKYTPWILKKINIQRVFFDEKLWDETVPKIDKFWNLVEECKLLPEEPEEIKKIKYEFISEDD